MKCISTNCSGSWMYNLTNSQKTVPFISCVIPYTSMYELIVNFNTIQWNKIMLSQSSIRKNTFILTIDDKIQLHFVHCIFTPSATHIEYKYSLDDDGIKRKSEIHYNHIWEYIVSKYKARLQRMLNNPEPPTFLIMQEPYANEKSSIQLSDFCDLNTPYKICIISDNKNLTSNASNIQVIVTNKMQLPQQTVRQMEI